MKPHLLAACHGAVLAAFHEAVLAVPRSAVLTALLLAATLSSCLRSPAAATEAKPEAAETPAEAAEEATREAVLVRARPVEQRTIVRTLEATANVESLDVVDVFPERTQPVLEILVEEGDEVAPGQVLARLRDKVEQLALAEMKVRLQEASDEWGQAKRDYERNKSLAEQAQGATRLISEREVEASQMAVVTAETAHKAAEVAVDRAEFDLSQCTITAPIAGTVSAREISLGDMANPAMRAFEIVDQSQPKAIFYRPQRELSELHVGQKLTATCEALPGAQITGAIERISPTVDADSGTVKVTAALVSPPGQPIPIGVLARLELELDRHVDALLVPKRALLFEGDRTSCFVVRDGAAVRVELAPGFEEPDFLEALPSPDGLRADDLVIVVGMDRLKDGDPVELAE